MWWIWLVLLAAAFGTLGVAVLRSRHGWGPRTGRYRDDQAEARTALWIARNRRSTGLGGR